MDVSAFALAVLVTAFIFAFLALLFMGNELALCLDRYLSRRRREKRHNRIMAHLRKW
jgi:hypothetical protein